MADIQSPTADISRGKKKKERRRKKKKPQGGHKNCGISLVKHAEGSLQLI